MRSITLILFCIIALLCYQLEGSKKTSVRRPTYYKYYYLKVPYHYKPIRWPKVKGRCKVIPNFKINGTNPVREEAVKGRVVILYLMKRTCKQCYQQLIALNDLADYYRETNQPVIIVALNHRRQPLSLKTMQRYPLIKFFEEPRNQDIFGQLRASRGHILVYDKCGRQQYSFAYPYSWLGYPFTRGAVWNSLHHHVGLCGKCSTDDTDEPTEAPGVTEANVAI